MGRARQILLALEDTSRELADYASGRGGSIRIGCVPTLAESLLPMLCEKLRQEAGSVKLDLRVSMNDVLLGSLKAGELDLILGPLVQTDEAFWAEEIGHDEMVVIAASNHPVLQFKAGIRDLLNYRWVLLAPSVASRQWLDAAFDRKKLPRPDVQITTTSINMILPLIARSDLLGFASKSILHAGSKGLREVPIKETRMHRRMGLTYRRDTYLSPAAQRLVAIIRQSVGAL